MASAQARFLLRLAEYDRRQAFRDDGATSVEAWSAERFGLSGATARAAAQVGDKAQDLPHLVGSLSVGEISFDKVRAVVDVATPETDEDLCAQAKDLSVRELAEVARMLAARARSARSPPHVLSTTAATCGSTTGTAPCRCSCRPTLCPDQGLCGRLGRDDPSRSRTRRFPWTSAAATGSWRWWTRPPQGHRSAGPSPFLVVAHVPLEDLVSDAGEPSELAGELEHHGLIDVETVQRIACDATVVVAVDDHSWATPCTRAGPSASRPGPKDEK